MRAKKRILTSILLLNLICTGLLTAQSVDEIINKHVKAMGGTEKLSQLKSIKIAANMEVMNMEVPVTTTIVQNKAFRTETSLQGMTIIQAIDGDTGWMINPMTGDNTPTPLAEETIAILSAQTDITGLFNYKEKGYKATLEGEEDLGGAKVYKVVITLPSGIQQTNYISKETFYILKIKSIVQVEGNEITSENKQSNFKQVSGITVPFLSEITSSAMPEAKMTNTITSVEINPKIQEGYFAMPK
jgi:hypothetical protein